LPKWALENADKTDMYNTIHLNIDDKGMARLALNRPEKFHALNAELIAEMTDAIGKISEDKKVHLVILESSGPHFCAGGDLRWMQDQMQADRQTKMAEAEKLSHMLSSLNQLEKPVIGRVQGNAYGGGLGLMCVCDIVVAAENARFALTETRLGLIPATIGPFVFRKLGEGATRQIFLTGSMIDANRALHLGLVSFVVPDTELDKTIAREAETALKAGPTAMGYAKRLLQQFSQTDDWQAQNKQAVSALADCWETQETQAGIKAFFDKQPAPWIKTEQSD